MESAELQFKTEQTLSAVHQMQSKVAMEQVHTLQQQLQNMLQSAQRAPLHTYVLSALAIASGSGTQHAPHRTQGPGRSPIASSGGIKRAQHHTQPRIKTSIVSGSGTRRGPPRAAHSTRITFIFYITL